MIAQRPGAERDKYDGRRDAPALGGNPPKPLGQIQATLKRIHLGNEVVPEPGPLMKGLRADGWVVVASRGDGWRLGECLAMLQSHGIRGRLSFCRGDFTVDVAERDFRLAYRCLAGHRRELTRPGRAWPLLVIAGFPAAAGAILGLLPATIVAIFFWLRRDYDVATASLAIVPCVAVGALLGVYGFVCGLAKELLPESKRTGCENAPRRTSPPRRRRMRAPHVRVHIETDWRRDWSPTLMGGLCGLVLAPFFHILLSYATRVYLIPDHEAAMEIFSAWCSALLGAIPGAAWQRRSHTRHS